MDAQSDRRKFLELVALGGGAGLLAAATHVPQARAAGTAEALLLTCMDFRLMDEIERYMSARGLRDKYDHVVLAGASLGAVTDKYPAWSKTFWEHLGFAIEQNGIRRVIVIDHRDCGAYKLILGEEHLKDAKAEKQAHAAELRKLKDQIRGKYPEIEVEMRLMSLGGRVEAIV